MGKRVLHYEEEVRYCLLSGGYHKRERVSFLGGVDTPLHTMSIGYKIIRSKNSETFCITEKHQRWSFFPAKLPNFYFNLTSLSKKWDKNLQKIFLVENLRTVAFGN